MDKEKKRKYNKVLAAISMLIFIRFMYGLVLTPEIGNNFKGCDNVKINSNRITNEEKNNINKFYENTLFYCIIALIKLTELYKKSLSITQV